MLINMTLVCRMQMAVVKIINVAAMANGPMTAVGPVGMAVIFVCFMVRRHNSILSFL